MLLKCDNGHSYLASGQALFLPLRNSLWNLRRDTKKQIEVQTEPQSYTVMQVIDFYPQMIDLTLSDKQSVLDKLGEHEAAMSGKKGDAFRCVAFWDVQNEEGILFHKHGREVLAAYLPPLTTADVIRERAISRCLKELSRSAKGIPTFLDHSIHSGKHSLSDLLESIRQWLE